MINKKERIIKAINNAIGMAIWHGGDPGGPYFTESEKLSAAMNELAECLNVSWKWSDKCPEGYKCHENEYPVLYLKEKTE